MTDSPTIRFPTWLGFVQGVVLYGLYKTYQFKLWPQDLSTLFNALLFVALLLPFVVYWGQGTLTRGAMRRLLGLAVFVFAGIGAYQGWAVFPLADALRPRIASAPTFLGLAMLAFMAVPLVSGWARGTPGAVLGAWHYPKLFDVAWRNAVITAQAGVLTGLLWIVLLLGAQLFQLIGIGWPKDLITETWFAIPLTTFAIALGLRAGIRREAFALTLRNHWLTLVMWLLPLASLIGTAFVLTSLTGVDKLFERGLSAFFLLWFAAFWIKFYNAAFQDGASEPALHPALRRVLPFASLALVGVVGLAAWALGLRILQYGLTPDRIWGALVVSVGLIYAVGYAGSLRTRGHWMAGIAPANVLAALVMSLGIVLLLSPALDANRLATASQMARLASGQTAAGDFDVHALAQQGRAGHAALSALKQRHSTDGKPDALALRAEDALDSARRYARGLGEDQDTHTQTIRFDVARVEHYPQRKAMPPSLVAFLGQEVVRWQPWEREQSCFAPRAGNMLCTLLLVDLDRDGVDEAVFWRMRDTYDVRVYALVQGQWARVGRLKPDGTGARKDSLRAQLATGDYATEPRRWDNLRLGTTRYLVNEGAP